MEPRISAATFAQVPLFAGFGVQERDWLAQRASLRSFAKNAILINEGDNTDALFVILAGRVKVFLCDDEGGEAILNFHGPGEEFGEMALLDDQPRSASVQTLEATRCAVLTKADFMHCMEACPSAALQVIRYLTHRLRALTDNVRSLALLDVYGRVARTLLNLAEPQGDKMVIKQRVTHQEIANLVGSSREMVTRILKDLAHGGYIVIADHTITLNQRLPNAW